MTQKATTKKNQKKTRKIKIVIVWVLPPNSPRPEPPKNTAVGYNEL